MPSVFCVFASPIIKNKMLSEFVACTAKTKHNIWIYQGMCHSQWKLSHKGSELEFNQNTMEDYDSFLLPKFV